MSLRQMHRDVVSSHQRLSEHQRGPITMALGSAPAEDFLEELRQEAGLTSWPSWQLSGARPGPGESTVQAQDRILRVWMEYLRAALTDV
jgi:broad specificity phosphatase PhoE